MTKEENDKGEEKEEVEAGGGGNLTEQSAAAAAAKNWFKKEISNLWCPVKNERATYFCRTALPDCSTRIHLPSLKLVVAANAQWGWTTRQLFSMLTMAHSPPAQDDLSPSWYCAALALPLTVILGILAVLETTLHADYLKECTFAVHVQEWYSTNREYTSFIQQ